MLQSALWLYNLSYGIDILSVEVGNLFYEIYWYMKRIPLELKRKFSLCEVLDLVQQSIYVSSQQDHFGDAYMDKSV